MRLDETLLLSRKNAMFYAGQLGDEKFDAQVAPHVRTKRIGSRTYYLRKDIDRWAGLDTSTEDSHLSSATLLDRL
jgi:hypothetical protein